MEQIKHYGTIVHWFDDLRKGSILPDDSAQRLFADYHSLEADYPYPKTGDRVGFYLDSSGRQPAAYGICPVPDYQAGEKTVITLEEWDFQQNGGYGSSSRNKGRPVFVLGQFLTDQTRVPVIGDRLEGRLYRHSNGQWLLQQAILLEKAVPVETRPASRILPVTEGLQAAGTPSPAELETEETAYQAKTPEMTEKLPTGRIIRGSVISWNDEKGYGFIHCGGKTPNVFFHISTFRYTDRRPKTGQAVSLRCLPADGCGRQKAASVVLRADEAVLSDKPPSSAQIDTVRLFGGITAAAAYLGAVALFSRKLAAAYLLLSAAAVWYYYQDKQTAKRMLEEKNGYLGRIPEATLLKIGLFGGWPGAMTARTAFNHKTRKTAFVRKFWLTAAANIAITYALLIHYADKPFISLLQN